MSACALIIKLICLAGIICDYMEKVFSGGIPAEIIVSLRREFKMRSSGNEDYFLIYQPLYVTFLK